MTANHPGLKIPPPRFTTAKQYVCYVDFGGEEGFVVCESKGTYLRITSDVTMASERLSASEWFKWLAKNGVFGAVLLKVDPEVE
jgi:hypothetical protein